MKKILFVLPLFLLASCGGTSAESSSDTSSPISNSEAYSEGSEAAKKALASLRQVGHKANVVEDIHVYRYDGAVCTRIKLIMDIAHSYGEDRAYTEQITSEHYQFSGEEDASTGEWIWSEEELTLSNSDIMSYYFADEDTGSLVEETLSVDNTVSKSFIGNYDDTTLVYTPYTFEEIFKNPWDYIRSSDIETASDGSLHLSLEKANFLVDCYTSAQLDAVNFVSDCLINVDGSGAVTSLTITTPDQVSEGRYRRTSELTITYSDVGTTSISHLAPKENDNPELESALHYLEDKTNYSISRATTITEGGVSDTPSYVHGYFTEERVLFHHLIEGDNDYTSEQNTKEPYSVGDDYDYKVDLEEDGIYHAYGWQYATLGWNWVVVSLNGTTPYTIDEFSGIGPSFQNIDASVFKKTGDLTYEAETEVLPVIGAYFDNGFQGVSSAVLDGGTKKCIVTLDENETMIEKVELSFNMLLETYDITLEFMNVGTTSIPDTLLSASTTSE